MTTPRTLEILHRRATTYEVAIYAPDGSVTVIGYTARRTKSALWNYARAHGSAILAHLDESNDPGPVYTKARGWQFGPVRVAFTGRTEREAATDAARIN